MSSCIKSFGNCASSLKNCCISTKHHNHITKGKNIILNNELKTKNKNINNNVKNLKRQSTYLQSNTKDIDLLSQNDNILMYKNAFDNPNSDRQSTNKKNSLFTTMTTINVIKPKNFSTNIQSKKISNI